MKRIENLAKIMFQEIEMVL
uniref:Uncharacterized protein n=1 Tax=Arundo donax TaxID=35708 RepID=A0A0A9C2Q9_ARUDO